MLLLECVVGFFKSSPCNQGLKSTISYEGCVLNRYAYMSVYFYRYISVNVVGMYLCLRVGSF